MVESHSAHSGPESAATRNDAERGDGASRAQVQDAVPPGQPAPPTATEAGEQGGNGAPLDAAAPAGVADPDAQIASLRDRAAAAEAAAAEARDQFLRARADIENVRRRAQEEVSKAHKFGIERFAEALVPVKDSLEAALAAAGSAALPESVRAGVEITLRQLASAFEKNGLVELNPMGERFDPHRHQAIAVLPAQAEPNTVVSVMQKGYMIADRVLRPALVGVAAPK